MFIIIVIIIVFLLWFTIFVKTVKVVDGILRVLLLLFLFCFGEVSETVDCCMHNTDPWRREETIVSDERGSKRKTEKEKKTAKMNYA